MVTPHKTEYRLNWWASAFAIERSNVLLKRRLLRSALLEIETHSYQRLNQLSVALGSEVFFCRALRYKKLPAPSSKRYVSIALDSF